MSHTISGDSHHVGAIYRDLMIGCTGQLVDLARTTGIEIVQSTPLFDGLKMVVKVDDRIRLAVNEHHSRKRASVALFTVSIQKGKMMAVSKPDSQ